MILKYGTFEFPQNRVWVEWRIQNVVNRRGQRMYKIIKPLFGGTVTGSSLDALDTAINGVESALASNNLDFILYRNDGSTPTKHAIDSSATLDGVKVNFLRWLKGTAPGIGNGREYENKRSFIAEVQAEVAANEVEIVEWHETIDLQGLGGDDFTIKESMAGSPQVQETQLETKCVLIQEGYAVGWSAYPSYPAAASSGSRSKLARRWAATPTIGRNTNRLYPIRWRYVHEQTTNPGTVNPTLPP